MSERVKRESETMCFVFRKRPASPADFMQDFHVSERATIDDYQQTLRFATPSSSFSYFPASVWFSHCKHKDAFEEMKHDELMKKTYEQFRSVCVICGIFL